MTRSIFSLEIPSSDIPGPAVNPWATSCEFMYWKLEVDEQEDVVLSKADPKSDMETSSAQCTLVIAVVVGVDVQRDRVTCSK